MENPSPTHTNRIGKRGAWVVPANLRHRYGLEEGTLVIAEPRPDGILLKPAMASAVLPTPARQSSVWHDWFDLMSEIKATTDEIAEAKAFGAGLMLVLDCSILMAWIMPDESSEYAHAVRDTIAQHNMPLIAPPLFFIEAINVLGMMESRKRMNSKQAESAVQLLQRLPVTVDAESILLSATLRIRQLMQQHGLTAYDASYLELAKRRNLPLSTLDKALRKAAEMESIFLWHKSPNPHFRYYWFYNVRL